MTLIQSVLTYFSGKQPDEKGVDIDGQRYDYLEIAVSDQPKAPLLIGIHGFGANEAQMKTLVGIELDEPFTYLALRAFEIHPTGGYSWFPFELTPEGVEVEESVLADCVDRIDAFIANAISQYDADPDRVIFVGYSQGGTLAFAYLLRHPERIAGSIAAAGGLLPEAMGWARPDALAGKQLFIGFGSLDPLIKRDEMVTAEAYFQDLGVATTLKEYRIPHVVSPTEVADMEAFIKQLL